MADAGAGAHPLRIAGADDFAGAERILVFEPAVENVGDNLHIGMAMGGEAAARRQPVLVDDAQRSEPHEARITIIAERKAMRGIEPAEVEFAAGIGRAVEHFHGWFPLGLRDCYQDG